MADKFRVTYRDENGKPVTKMVKATIQQVEGDVVVFYWANRDNPVLTVPTANLISAIDPDMER